VGRPQVAHSLMVQIVADAGASRTAAEQAQLREGTSSTGEVPSLRAQAVGCAQVPAEGRSPERGAPPTGARRAGGALEPVRKVLTTRVRVSHCTI
jgi:hypothetical protein